MSTKMATGISKGESGKEAAEKAVEMAKKKLGEQKIDMVIVYSATNYNYEEVVGIVRKLTNNAPLAGCSTGGEFTEKAVEKGSVAITLLSSDKMKFSTAAASGVKESENEVMRKIVSQIPQKNKEYPYRAAIILMDGLAGKGEEIAIAAVNVLGVDTKLVGGAAGDDLKFKQTFVFCNDQVLPDAVSICVIDSKTPFYTGVKHGHTVLSETMKVTKSQGSVLFEIDNRPAWNVWKEKTAKDAREAGIEVDELKEASQIGSLLLRYELGISMGGEDYKIRVPLSKNDDGSLNFACTIPQGISFNIMKSVKEKQTESANKAASLALSEAPKNTLFAGALIFDCVCRGLILGDDFYQAVDEFKKVLGKIPLSGFETYGEVCYVKGEFSGFHNTTSVVLLLPAE